MILTDDERAAILARPKPPAESPPWQILGVSQTQFSIAKFCGGIKLNGHRYTYDPADDSLTRDDVLDEAVKMRRVAKEPSK